MRDISLHLMDIMQNSISAKANKITVSVNTDETSDELVVEISDNGMGMDEDLLNKVTDPFFTTRTTRKVGLGIPLLEDSAKMAEGGLTIQSVKGKGTMLTAVFKISHIDRLPLGDISETVTSLVAAYPDIEIILELNSIHGHFRFDTQEIKEKLGDVPIDHYEVILWIREFINDGIKFCFGGVLNEIDR